MKQETSVPREAPHSLRNMQMRGIELLSVVCLILLPNLYVASQVNYSATHHTTGWLQQTQDALSAMPWTFYATWLTLDIALVGLLIVIHRYLLAPLRRIVIHLSAMRNAYHEGARASSIKPFNIRMIAVDVGRFAGLAIDYYRKHQEVSHELAEARAIIAQFALHQQTVVTSTDREIGDQYRSVLAYANYLEEQIVNNRLDPTLRYDFDDVCESSFNLKLIAGALSILSSNTKPDITTVPIAGLMQQMMLSLAPSLDRRSMKLTTAEVDLNVAAEGDPRFLAHILWMMLLGMVRYAADESTLRIRCLHSRDGKQALISIVVSELSPLQLSAKERHDFLVRQLQHLTPHMFAETIRIHGNIQLAHLLLQRMGGSIDIQPLTISSCEICMMLPSATLR